MTDPANGHEELQELLGAYALDALDETEVEEVERHLQGCPVCRAEVAQHRDMAAMLSPIGVEPPARVWEQIVARLAAPPASAPPARRGGRSGTHRPAGTVSIRTMAALTAAAAVIILALGIEVVHLDRRKTASTPVAVQTALQQAARAALTSPGARRVTLRSSDGKLSIDVVIARDGTGYIVSNDLPALPDGRTYQLWGETHGQLVSFGVLGGRPGVRLFRAEAPVVALAVTAERAGGVPAPSEQPLLIANLPS